MQCVRLHSNRIPWPFSWGQKILTLDKFINHQEGIFAYKEINGTYLLNDILTDRFDLNHYQLRNDEYLRIPLHITTRSLFCIRYRSIKTLNSLPRDLRSKSFLASFRRKLKLLLHQQYVSAKYVR